MKAVYAKLNLWEKWMNLALTATQTPAIEATANFLHWDLDKWMGHMILVVTPTCLRKAHQMLNRESQSKMKKGSCLGLPEFESLKDPAP